CIVIDQKIYFINTDWNVKILVYDILNDKWQELANHQIIPRRCRCVVFEGKIYLITTNSNYPPKDIRVYDVISMKLLLETTTDTTIAINCVTALKEYIYIFTDKGLW